MVIIYQAGAFWKSFVGFMQMTYFSIEHDYLFLGNWWFGFRNYTRLVENNHLITIWCELIVFQQACVKFKIQKMALLKKNDQFYLFVPALLSHAMGKSYVRLQGPN